jgi:hypothetical protein
VTLYTNKASTAWPTSLQLFVNATSIGTVTIPANAQTGTLTTFTSNQYIAWSLFSYEFTAIGEPNMTCQMIIESQDV